MEDTAHKCSVEEFQVFLENQKETFVAEPFFTAKGFTKDVLMKVYSKCSEKLFCK